jgi:hypothetical protein
LFRLQPHSQWLQPVAADQIAADARTPASLELAQALDEDEIHAVD